MTKRPGQPIDRRRLLQTGAATALSAVASPAVLRAQTTTLKVGVILPLSGVISFPGIATRRGTELAVKMFGDDGVKLDVSYVDTESKPENGRIAAEKLIRDGVSLLRLMRRLSRPPVTWSDWRTTSLKK